MSIDDMDKKILFEMQKDGRISNADLAERIGLSQSACFRRVKQLEEDGVIAGYHAEIAPRKVGLNLAIYALVSMEKHTETTLDEFMKAVRLMPEIVECHAVSGSADYFLKVMVRDMDAYAQIALHKLVRLPGVKGISSNFILKTIDTKQIKV